MLLHLTTKPCRALRQALVLALECIDLSFNVRSLLLRVSCQTLLKCLLHHGHLCPNATKLLRNFALTLHGLVPAAAPVPFSLPNVVNAHGGTQLRKVASDNLADALLQLPLLLAHVCLVLGQPLRLRRHRGGSCLRATELLAAKSQVGLAALPAALALAQPGLEPPRLLLRRARVHDARGAHMNLMESSVNDLQPLARWAERLEVKARGAVARGLGAHGHVSVSRDRLATERDESTAKASGTQLMEDEVPSLL
mmetsp:Transcript_66701/g.171775  ORF Transcript_66701/g.171775 Transcript_66701/m.171775 type:complete len:253 (-) Transcript_66701:1238-1996(-)